MKKLLCTLLMLVPALGFAKAFDEIVVGPDGLNHTINPQNTLTFAIESHIREIREFTCMIFSASDKDDNAPYILNINNYDRDGSYDGTTSGQAHIMPRVLKFKGKIWTTADNNAYFHFLNNDYTKRIIVSCRPTVS